MAGQVVGMNTAIYTQSMGSQGVGFAMPSNIIASVYNMLIGPEHKVVRGSIGISFQTAQSSAVGRVYGFTNGVIVGVVTPNGGAAKAGIQAGDVIVSIDGRNIKDGDDLVNDISARHVGSTVKLGYLRDGKQNTANVAIGDRAKTYADITGQQDEPAAPSKRTPEKASSASPSRPSRPSIAAKTGIKGGVMVTSVRPGSFADEIGLGKTPIITAINANPSPTRPATGPSSPPSNPKTMLSSSSRSPARRTSTPTLAEHSRRPNWAEGKEGVPHFGLSLVDPNRGQLKSAPQKMQTNWSTFLLP